MDAKSLEFDKEYDNRPIKLFFQDEARFGRIDSISSCWVPHGCRARVGNQVVREYTYAYLTVCPETGENFSLILPYLYCVRSTRYVNKNCMDIFLNSVSEAFSNYRIVMAMDTCAAQSASRASWHSGIENEKWKNIVPLFQPPYSPEVNPVENLWHHIREEGGFTNRTFNTLEEVEVKLAEKLKNLDEKTVQSITLFRWIKDNI